MKNNEIFGAMSVDVLFSVDQLKHIRHNASLWQILEAFVRQTEGVASRVAFGPTGAILLTTVPGDPNSGAFYLYDQSTRSFYTITFEGKDEFNALNFDMVMMAYDLHMLLDTAEKHEERRANRSRNRRRRHHGRRRNNNASKNMDAAPDVHVVYSKATRLKQEMVA